jgi:carboxypeptidase Q
MSVTKRRVSAPRSAAIVLGFCLLGVPALVFGQARPTADERRPAETQPAATQPADDPPARIRDVGLNHSEVMQTLSYLTDVIGPRLTGSPNLRRANEWTRERMASWGLVEAHLEPWGPFGRGWSLRRFSAQVIGPQTVPLVGCPKAWSPGFERPVVAQVVHMDPKADADLEPYRGKLRGVAVLVGPAREMQARFEPLAVRLDDADLLRMANSDGSPAPFPGRNRSIPPSERRAMLAGTALERTVRGDAPASRPATSPATGPSTVPTTGPATGPTTTPSRGPSHSRLISFLMEEGAAVLLTTSEQGDGGTYFVGSASLPDDSERRAEDATAGGRTRPRRPRPWDADAPATMPQVVLAAEQFNRLVRMTQQGERLTLALDLQVSFHDDDSMGYNTIAEIPGTDLRDEVVMLGAHLDSWHSATGATDNAAGVAAVMEAVRILKATGAEPRRTIRVGLWTGEEQGLFGSKAHVAKHYGYVPETTGDDEREDATTRPADARPADARPADTRPADTRPADTGPATGPASRPARQVIRLDGHAKFSAYFNLDNGTGKIRGVYLQNNEAVRPIFRKWLKPFNDLGASTLTLANTGGTDHTSFDAVGLPGFQFIQDPVEYWTRTHHSNADTYERVQADDLKQASVILATFAYNAAMADEKLPRKPQE